MGNKLNKLLLRQIKRHFGSPDNLPEELKDIIHDINNTYNDFDDDTQLIQNSIEISSRELRDAFQKQKNDAEVQQETITKIKEAIFVLTPSGKNGINESETIPSGSSYLFDSQIRLIEERKQAEKEILKLSKAVEQSPASIVITDIKGNIEYVNPKFCNLSGYTKEEVIGKNPRILKSETYSPDFFKDLWTTILSGNEWKGEFHNKKKNGDLYWELSSISAIKNSSGEIVNFLAVKEDITERKQTEETFQNERALFRTIIDLIPNAVYVKDTRGRKILANPEEVQLAGMDSEDEVIGKTDPDLYPAEQARRSADEDHLVLQSGKPILNIEGTLTDKEGRLHSLLVSKVPLYDLQGKISGLVGVTHDITERKQMENKLKENENLQRSLLENIAVGIVIIDPETRVIESVNTFASLLIGESSENIIGRRCHQFMCPAQDHLCPVCDKGQVVDNSERILLRADKSTLPVLKTVKKIQIGGKEKLLESFVDITMQKKAEESLQQSSKKWEAIIAASPDGIGMVSLEGKLQLMSEKLAKMYNYSIEQRDEYIGKTIFDFIDPSSHKLLTDNFQKLLVDKKEQKITEYLAIRKDRSRFYVDVNSTILLDSNGNPASILFVERDITERKLAEEKLKSYTDQIELKNIELDIALTKAEEAKAKANEMTEQAEMANKAKSTFLANMSHEIRTPLNAIIGFSQLINRDPLLTSTQKEYNISIIRAGEHLLLLINDILELSKIEAGRVELNPTNVDLYSLFNDIQIIFKERAQSKHLQFIFETADDLPRYVIVDDGKLRQIFVNLIGNAIKFTDEGGIAVRVRVDKTDEDISSLIVEIQDSGPGIPENEISNLFKHFEQTSSGIKKSNGTGLGLALSRELAVIMGGNITVISEPGKGSVFTFHVEIKEGKIEAVETDITKRVIHLDKGQQAYRVLVVDDKQENLQVVVNLLKLVGFATNEAVNGEDAIKKFEEWRPHLILMDMRMPVMDGYEATRQIKSMEKGKTTPIIALTASSFEEERKKTLALGMQGYIRKPFRESELFGVIGKVLGVKYIYEEETASVPEKYLYDDEAIVGDIAKLPLNLLLKMQNAVEVADFDLLVELINSIDPDHSELPRRLMALANDFDYNSLQQILNQKDTK
ncbi:MAG: PAS domain S-box protein [Bacteroidota bacterium]